MRVERAIGEPGLCHNAGKSCRCDAMRPELARLDIDDPLPGDVLASLFVAHTVLAYLRRPHQAFSRAHCIMIIIIYYDHNSKMKVRVKEQWDGKQRHSGKSPA